MNCKHKLAACWTCHRYYCDTCFYVNTALLDPHQDYPPNVPTTKTAFCEKCNEDRHFTMIMKTTQERKPGTWWEVYRLHSRFRTGKQECPGCEPFVNTEFPYKSCTMHVPG